MTAAPIHNLSLIGHDEAMRQVVEVYTSGRMHHAWLITGVEGIGKMALAQHIASYVLSSAHKPLGTIDPHHRVSKLVLNESHPDMLAVRRKANDKGELRDVIVVEDALKIASFLHKTATHGGWRVVIIDEAHALNRHGQNAILKIIEEPPERTLILMTVTTPGALLPTIRSRCRVLPLAPLDEAHMRAILGRTAPQLSGDELDKLIALSGGSIGFALKIVQSEALPLYEELMALLDAAPQLDVPRLHKLADQMSRKADAETFGVVTTLLLQRLRDETVAAAHNGAGGGLVNAKLNMWDKTRETLSMVDYSNLDRKLALVNAVDDLK